MRTVLQRLSVPLVLLGCTNNSGGTATQPGETESATIGGDPTGASATDPTGATVSTGEPVPTTGDPTSDGPTSDGPTTQGTDPGTTLADTTDGATTSTGTTDPIDTTGPARPCEAGDEQACYSGPDGTVGVAGCKAGVSTCDDRGQWGACVGEVLPGVESCETPGDEDCDDVDPCVGGTDYAWHKVWGDGGHQTGAAIMFDATGSLIVAAHGGGTSDFGGGPLPASGVRDLYLAKFAPDGAHVWSKRFGSGGEVFADGWALTVDPAGDLLIAGAYKGKLDLGGGPMQSAFNASMFVARLTGDGAHVWSQSYDTGNTVRARDIALDGDGEIYLGGYFIGELDLGGGPMVAPANSFDGFVGKFTAAGEHAWSLRIGDGQTQVVMAVAVDDAGTVTVGGHFEGTLNAGDGQLVSAGGYDVFLAQYSPIGNIVWSARHGDADIQQLLDLAIGPDGRISGVGVMDGTIDLGGGPLSALDLGGFAFQIDPDGAHRWSQLLGSDNLALPNAIVADSLGSLLLAGYFNGTVDLGGGPLVAAGGNDIFMLKLGPAGNHVWDKRFGDNDTQTALATAVSATGEVAIAGAYDGGLNFGGGPNTSKGQEDGFIAVFAP